MSDIAALEAQLASMVAAFREGLGGCANELAIRTRSAEYLGKKGQFSAIMRELGSLPGEQRPRLGDAVNRAKTAIETAADEALAALAAAARATELARRIDVTLPARNLPRGHLHILTQVRRDVVDVFRELGFEVAEGPQIETDWNNFEALAMPKAHPARDMQDTFYVSDDIVLRTHTSPVQVRTMLAQTPPIRIVAPGIVYRRDDDPTHSPMFTQIEGLVVDKAVSFADLKGTLLHFVNRFFGKRLGIRLRPSYFPFVEPGAEVDMQCVFCGGGGCRLCKHSGWIEIGGAGMVDPDVFAHVKIDSELYSGFAFGMGIERMAMLRHDIRDIKWYYDPDMRFLTQF